MTEKPRCFAEVQNHHVEEVEDIHGIPLSILAIVIDGYKTDDENEQGTVIAKVFGIKIDNDVRVFVEYHDMDARIDELAQESIREAVERMPSLFVEEISKGQKVKINIHLFDQNQWEGLHAGDNELGIDFKSYILENEDKTYVVKDIFQIDRNDSKIVLDDEFLSPIGFKTKELVVVPSVSCGVTIIQENNLFTVEVDEIQTGTVLKTYEETFETSTQADQFVKDVVEKEFDIVNYHMKNLDK